MEKQKSTVTILVSVAIGLILMLVLVNSLADSTTGPTTLSTSSEQTNLSANNCYNANGQVDQRNSTCNITVTNNPTGWKTDECPLTSVVVTNYSGTVLTLNTDYKLTASTGRIDLLNTTSTNKTNMGGAGVVKYTYSYCGTGYLNSSWGRTLLGTTVGIIAVSILVYCVYLVYSLYKPED